MRNLMFFISVFFFVNILICQIKIKIDPNTLKDRFGKGSKTEKATKNTNTNSYNFERNPNAPENINNDLKLGEYCVAIDSRGNLSFKSVYSVVNGGYGLIASGATEWEIKNNSNSIQYYALNSVYPEVNFTEFNKEVGAYEMYIKPFMECFSKSYNMTLGVLKGPLSTWPKYYFADVKEVELYRTKLTELDKIIQQKYSNFPNYYCKYNENPYVWVKIASDRENMIKCLISTSGTGGLDRELKLYLDDAEDAMNAIDKFNNGADWSVGATQVERALSPKARQEFYDNQTGFKEYAAFAALGNGNKNMPYDTMNAAYDKIKTALKVAMLKHKPDDSWFKYHDAGLESKMKAHLKNIAALKVYKIGLSHDAWQIEQNNYGIPVYRYKYGQLYVKSPNTDHGYCLLLFYSMRQDYSGGGTYGESYVGSYSESIYACP